MGGPQQTCSGQIGSEKMAPGQINLKEMGPNKWAIDKWAPKKLTLQKIDSCTQYLKSHSSILSQSKCPEVNRLNYYWR